MGKIYSLDDKEWMKKLKYQVITVDGALPIDYLISQIGEINAIYSTQ